MHATYLLLVVGVLVSSVWKNVGMTISLHVIVMPTSLLCRPSSKPWTHTFNFLCVWTFVRDIQFAWLVQEKVVFMAERSLIRVVNIRVVHIRVVSYQVVLCCQLPFQPLYLCTHLFVSTQLQVLCLTNKWLNISHFTAMMS